MINVYLYHIIGMYITTVLSYSDSFLYWWLAYIREGIFALYMYVAVTSPYPGIGVLPPVSIRQWFETVNQLMLYEENKWDEGIVKGIFDPATATIILQTHINIFEPTSHSHLIWMLEKLGAFTPRSAYRMLTETISLNHPITFKKLWARREIQSRVLHFMWQCLNDALTMNEHRARIIPRANDACPLRSNKRRQSLTSYFISPQLLTYGMNQDQARSRRRWGISTIIDR